MRVAVVGSGGREHALCWAIARGGHEVVPVPGNPGTERWPAGAADPASLAAHDLVVIGPEAPLVAGLADAVRALDTPVFGPGAAGARLEGSKAFAREFCARHQVASPMSAAFDHAREARAFLERTEGPWFIKADGLCGGKGAFPAPDRATADTLVGELLESGSLGAAGETIVIEEWLEGPEVSLHLLVSAPGPEPAWLPLSRDHKRRHDGDLGPNTGGMGAIAPVPLEESVLGAMESDLVAPTIAGLGRDGIPYRGVLYLGVMLTKAGPRLLEYNVRFGDPETQVLLPLLDGDAGALLLATATGGSLEPRLSTRGAATVVLVAAGYPEAPESGLPLPSAPAPGAPDPGALLLFQAGTARENGDLVSSGGRIMAATGIGASLEEALGVAYAALPALQVPGTSYRRDIGR